MQTTWKRILFHVVWIHTFAVDSALLRNEQDCSQISTSEALLKYYLSGTNFYCPLIQTIKLSLRYLTRSDFVIFDITYSTFGYCSRMYFIIIICLSWS